MTAKNSRTIYWASSRIFDNVYSFTDIESRINQLAEEKDRGDVLEIFIEGYLATQSIAQCKEHWVVGSIPLALRERYNLPSDGTGIDGIYEATDGTHVAYQVKYRQKSNLTYQEVAPFLGLTERFTDRVIFTNAATLAHQAVARTRWVSRQDFVSLTPEALNEITSWIIGKPVERKRAEPDPRYQTQVLADIAKSLETNSRATVVMACGTGKTLVALWAVEQAKPKTVLVLLPSLSLVQQTVREWGKHHGWGSRFSFICVCSDATVAKDVDVLELDTSDVGFRVDTDPATVNRFLATSDDAVRVVFSTYQSSDVVAEGVKGLPAFDIAVFDEAHKTTGLAGGQFSRALSDDHIPISKRLFFTATPRHIDIRSKRDKDGEYKVQSMDDPAFYGPRAHTLSFKAATDREVICPYKVVISLVDKDLVDDFARKNGITLVDGDEVGVRWVSNLVALQQAIEQTGATKVITFHSRVKLADEFASDSPRGIGRFLDGFEVRHVNGKQRSSDRAELIKSFAESAKGIITNARCLTEGVDIPAVDMVAFIDPRQSRVDIAQAVGRAMRKPRGATKKTVGYVFVPLFLGSEGESIDDAIKSERFDAVADVLNALQEHDEELVDLIREARQARGQGKPFKPRVLVDKVMMIGPRVELSRVVESVETKLVDTLGSSWDEYFGVLLEWRRANQDGFPRVDEVFTHYKIGRWVDRQRATYQQAGLNSDRVSKLERLPGWTWDYRDWLWERGLAALRVYEKKNGDTKVPDRYVDDDGYNLASFVKSKRRQYEMSELAEERVKLLEAFSGWMWRPNEESWHRMYSAIKDRLASESLPEIEQSRDIYGTWILKQKSRYSAMHGGTKVVRKALTQEQIILLSNLSGWSWDRRKDSWMEHFNAVVDYKEQHEGRLPSMTDKKFEWQELRVIGWISKQRQRRDIREPWQVTLLEQRLPELLDSPFEVKWRECYEVLLRYVDIFGSAEVRQETVFQGSRIGVWVSKQRSRYRAGRLEDSKIRLLESLKGWRWDASSMSASGLSKQGISPKKNQRRKNRYS
jgi:superfamily II DNA or RNA helicase